MDILWTYYIMIYLAQDEQLNVSWVNSEWHSCLWEQSWRNLKGKTTSVPEAATVLRSRMPMVVNVCTLLIPITYIYIHTYLNIQMLLTSNIYVQYNYGDLSLCCTYVCFFVRPAAGRSPGQQSPGHLGGPARAKTYLSHSTTSHRYDRYDRIERKICNRYSWYIYIFCNDFHVE